MRTILINISVIIMTFFVMLLSIGINISRMQCCDTNNKIFIGQQVPSCNTEKDLICTPHKDISCCFLGVEELCCPDEENCLITTDLIQFNFETIVKSYNQLITSSTFFVLIFLSADSFCLDLYHSNITYRPPRLCQPIFSQIQSFLL